MSDVPQDRTIEDDFPRISTAPCEERPIRVLVAESDPRTRIQLVSALRDDGHEVVEITSGEQLWDLLARESLAKCLFDHRNVLVCDLRLPGCCGLDILVGLKMASWPVPVILTSTHRDQDRYATARWLGAAAIFDNPFDIDDLRTLVLNVTRLH